jgi:hypothetical protein
MLGGVGCWVVRVHWCGIGVVGSNNLLLPVTRRCVTAYVLESCRFRSRHRTRRQFVSAGCGRLRFPAVAEAIAQHVLIVALRAVLAHDVAFDVVILALRALRALRRLWEETEPAHRALLAAWRACLVVHTTLAFGTLGRKTTDCRWVRGIENLPDGWNQMAKRHVGHNTRGSFTWGTSPLRIRR